MTVLVSIPIIKSEKVWILIGAVLSNCLLIVMQTCPKKDDNKKHTKE